jgi:hypothetical protein
VGVQSASCGPERKRKNAAVSCSASSAAVRHRGGRTDI